MKDIDLLAAHLVGDYIFQTDEEAKKKFTERKHLEKHVFKYTLAFVPFLFFSNASGQSKASFLALLALTHYITDSRRWSSGEDWPSRPILVDQALHAVQLAILRRILG
jgi:hypothetical protein